MRQAMLLPSMPRPEWLCRPWLVLASATVLILVHLYCETLPQVVIDIVHRTARRVLVLMFHFILDGL
jgi:hypothetical protein